MTTTTDQVDRPGGTTEDHGDDRPDRHEGPPSETEVDQVRPIGRRGVLGALAAGAVLAACRSGEDLATVQPSSSPTTPTTTLGSQAAPGSTSVPGAASPTIRVDVTTEPVLEAGPEVGQVVLPTPAEPVPEATSGGATTAGGGGGATTGSSDRPDVIVVDDGSTPGTATVSTEPPTGQPSTSSETTTPGTTAAETTTQQPATGSNPQPSTTEAPPAQPVELTGPGVLDARTAVMKLTFGPTSGLLGQVESMGPKAFVEDQLGRTGPDRQVENQLTGYPYLGLDADQAVAANDGKNPGGRLVYDLTYANVVRAVYSRNQLYEMMCQLWMDHFNVNINLTSMYTDHQDNVVRRHAMTSFREMLVASATSPAMLHYLDNEDSNGSDLLKVNENYGRELLELHTLGIEPDGSQIYSQADVEQTSLAMSGWSTSLSRPRRGAFGTFRYRDDYAYKGEVSILGGAWTSNGLAGKARGDSLLEFLAKHPSTARHVAYKICRRFVSDTPPDDLVASAARVYLDNDTRIVPVLAHVFGSREFANSGGAKLRRPIEFLVAAIRATSGAIPQARQDRPVATVRNFLRLTRNSSWGWEQPDGYPDRSDHWISSDAFLFRWNLAGSMARNRMRGIEVDVGKFTPGGVTSAGDLVQAMSQQFGMGRLSDDVVRATLAAVDRSIGDAASALDERAVQTVTGLLLANPLFQIR
ncbi:MAG: DUF1800 domain-containing protein [Actinomycetota bacterium]